MTVFLTIMLVWLGIDIAYLLWIAIGGLRYRSQDVREGEAPRTSPSTSSSRTHLRRIP